jgi:hypothetical protein
MRLEEEWRTAYWMRASTLFGFAFLGASGCGMPSQNASQGVAAVCDAACQDYELAFATDNASWLLYNENVAGRPGGSVNVTARCPLAGTVVVSGATTVASNGVQMVQLTFNLTGCTVSATTYALTFDGAIHMTGTFTSDVQNDITFSSDALAVDGHLLVLNAPMVNEMCPVSVTDTWDHDPNNRTWLNGAVCGRITSSAGVIQ